MYLTYMEYQTLGGTITDTAFSLLEFKARKEIDSLTQNRVQKMATIPEEIKRCVFELVGKLDLESQSGGGVLTSESSGSYSYSIDNANTKTSISDSIKTYLRWVKDDNGIYLLYAGVD